MGPCVDLATRFLVRAVCFEGRIRPRAASGERHLSSRWAIELKSLYRSRGQLAPVEPLLSKSDAPFQACHGKVGRCWLEVLHLLLRGSLRLRVKALGCCASRAAWATVSLRMCWLKPASRCARAVLSNARVNLNFSCHGGVH